MSVRKVSFSEYEKYVNDCIEKGFTYVIESDLSSYVAFNSDGYELDLDYHEYNEVLDIHLDVRITGKIKWSNSKLAALLPIPKSDVGSIVNDYTYGYEAYLGETSKELFEMYVTDCSEIGFNIEMQRQDKSFFAKNKLGYELTVEYYDCDVMYVELSIPSEIVNEQKSNQEKNEIVDSEAKNNKDTNDAITISNVEPTIKNPFTKRNFLTFKETYENSLIDIFNDNQWELTAIKYPDLIRDDYKESYKPDRINEYDVFVYLKGNQLDGEKMYNAIIGIRCNNKYLLSNTYKLLSEGSYVDDDCNETGFHQVNTVLVFDDGTEYKIDFRSLLKNGEAIYKNENSSNSSWVYANGDECGYPECDHKRAEGKPYCHQHKCNESGCNNSTDLLPEYCDQHNCTYGSCTAPRYKAAGSTYCQRHYIEKNS